MVSLNTSLQSCRAAELAADALLCFPQLRDGATVSQSTYALVRKMIPFIWAMRKLSKQEEL